MDNAAEALLAAVVGVVCAILLIGGLWLFLGSPVQRTECRVHAEYTKTDADTAAVVKRIPFCAKVFYAD